MFKLLLYTTLLNLIVSVSSFAQNSPPNSKPHFDQSEVDRLLKKSKNQKITAWSMLGGGVLLVGIGIVFNENTRDNIYSNAYYASDYFFGFGLVSMLGSVPFFISSGKNKRKARAMVGTTYYPNPTAPTHLKAMPSAGIQITLR
jgi:hypothetical protein